MPSNLVVNGKPHYLWYEEVRVGGLVKYRHIPNTNYTRYLIDNEDVCPLCLRDISEPPGRLYCHKCYTLVCSRCCGRSHECIECQIGD